MFNLMESEMDLKFRFHSVQYKFLKLVKAKSVGILFMKITYFEAQREKRLLRVRQSGGHNFPPPSHFPEFLRVAEPRNWCSWSSALVSVGPAPLRCKEIAILSLGYCYKKRKNGK